MKVSTKYNLKKLYPKIASQWYSKKNNKIKPEQISPKSAKKFWWQCTLKNFHLWEARVSDRTSHNSGCPFCAGKKISKDNNLKSKFPHIAKEWHYEKNGKDKPENFTYGFSGKKFWWKCECGHEWKTKIQVRTSGNNCPECSKKIISKKVSLSALNRTGSLVKKNPLIAKQWYYKKNKDLDPNLISAGSRKKVWWICESNHIWQAEIGSRIIHNRGCPFCSHSKNTYPNKLESLKYKYPKIAKQLSDSNNVDPKKIYPGSNKTYLWICDKNPNHSWKSTVINRVYANSGCPYCSGAKVTYDNNLKYKNPDLAKQWHNNKNGNLLPEHFTEKSGKKVWWKCQHGHEWQAKIYSRSNGRNCPKCFSQTSRIEIRIYCEIKKIFNEVLWREKINNYEADIFIKDINTIIEIDGYYWHKNKYSKDKKKFKYFSSINYSVINLRNYGLKNISQNDLIYKDSDKEIIVILNLFSKLKNISSKITSLNKRKLSNYIKNRKFINDKEFKKILAYLPSPPLNKSLLKTHPLISSEWNFDLNKPLKPEMFTYGSSRRVFWKCSKNHSWSASISSRTSVRKEINGVRKTIRKDRKCPYCSSNSASISKTNNLNFLYPNIAKEWHKLKNKPTKPSDVRPGSNKKFFWICSKIKCKNVWEASINNRVSKKSGCPKCSNKRKGRKKSEILLEIPSIDKF